MATAAHGLDDVEVSSSTASTTSHNDESEQERGPPRACVFVANFRSENEPELRELLERHGTILRLKVLRDSQSPRTYAFVQYRLPADADRAILHTHGFTLSGRTLRVELAKVQRTLFLAKLPQSMDEEQLRGLVQEYGPIEKLTIITNHLTQKSRCCGFVKFAYREDAVTAFDALRNSQRRWIVEWSISHDSDPTPVAEKPDTVFIGNLPHSADKEGRRSPLRPASSTTSSTSSSAAVDGQSTSDAVDGLDQTDDNGSTSSTASPAGRSFAFVRFSEHSAAAAALEQNGAMWDDCQLRCEPAEAKSRRNRTNQRGSGGSASDRSGAGGSYGGNTFHGSHPPTLLHRQIYPRDRRLRPQEYDPAAAAVLGYRDAHHLYYQPMPELTSTFDPRTTAYHAAPPPADVSIRRAGGGAGGGGSGGIGPAVGYRNDGGHRHQHRNGGGPLGPYVHPGYAAPGAGRYPHTQPAPHQSRRGGAAPAFAPAYSPHHSPMTQQLYPSAAAAPPPPHTHAHAHSSHPHAHTHAHPHPHPHAHAHAAGPTKRREFALEGAAAAAGPDSRLPPTSPVSRQSPPTFAHFQPMGAEYDSSPQWAAPAAYPPRSTVRQHRTLRPPVTNGLRTHSC